MPLYAFVKQMLSVMVPADSESIVAISYKTFISLKCLCCPTLQAHCCLLHKYTPPIEFHLAPVITEAPIVDFLTFLQTKDLLRLQNEVPFTALSALANSGKIVRLSSRDS
jgi:hypothetical protein